MTRQEEVTKKSCYTCNHSEQDWESMSCNNPKSKHFYNIIPVGSDMCCDKHERKSQ